MTERYLMVDGRRAYLTHGGVMRGCAVVDDATPSPRAAVSAIGYVGGLMVTVTHNPTGAPQVDVLGFNLKARIPGAGSTLIPWAEIVGPGPLPPRMVIQARPISAGGVPTGPYSHEVDVDLSELIDPADLPSCIGLPTLTFGATPAIEGVSVTATAGVWAGATQGPATALMRWTPADGGAVTAVAPLWTVVPEIAGDILLQVGSRVTALDGTVVEAWSAQYRVYDPDTLITMTAGDVAFGDHVYEPGGQTQYWKPRVTFPGLSAVTVFALRWRLPAGTAEPMESLGSGVYRPVSASPGSPPADLSFFENDGARQIQFGYQATDGGPWSPWSATITMAGITDATIAAIPTAAVQTGMRRSLITYNVANSFSDGTEGATANAAEMTRSFVAVALAAWRGDATVYTGGQLPAGGRTPSQRLVDQLRHWAANRIPPCTYGYASQFQSAFVLAVCIAKTMPAVWAQLTAAEQTRIDLALKGTLVSAAFITGDANPFYSGGQPNERTIRGFSAGRSNVPNFCVATRLTPFLIAHVLGPSAAATFLNDWTRAAFLAEIEAAFAAYIPGSAAARCDIWETWRRQWTDAVQTEIHGAGHDGKTGPTEAQIQAAIQDWSLTYNDVGGAGAVTYRLGDGALFLPTEIRRCTTKVVKPGLGPNLEGAGASVYGIYESNPAVSNARNAYVGRLMDMADAADLPNPGATGMWRELDDIDGGRAAPRSINLNVRSGLKYSMSGYTNLVVFVAAYIVLGLAQRDAVGMASAMARLEIATRDLEFKIQRGYRDVAKGGRPSTNCSDYPAGSTKAEEENQISVPVLIHDDVVQPWYEAG